MNLCDTCGFGCDDTKCCENCDRCGGKCDGCHGKEKTAEEFIEDEVNSLVGLLKSRPQNIIDRVLKALTDDQKL